MRPGSPSRPQQKSLLLSRGPAEHVQPALLMSNALCVPHTPCFVCRSSYLLQRRDGLAAVYSRKTQGLTVRIYQLQSHVVKEYTGDTSKVGGRAKRGEGQADCAVLASFLSDSSITHSHQHTATTV